MVKSSRGKFRSLVAALALVTCATATSSAMAQAIEPFLGQTMLVPYSFCPRGWANAAGQILPIQQNTALFSLLGTTFGGDGRTTFALPNLQGRVPIGFGQGAGLNDYALGETGGSANVTLTLVNLPMHTHLIRVTNAFADKPGPGGKYLAADNTGLAKYHDGPPNKTMNPMMITATGGSVPFNVENPYTTLLWCIALQGAFPPRP